MRKFIKRARRLGVDFEYGTIIRMAGLFDVGEALNAERTRLADLGFPTRVHDDLITKIQDEFLTEAAIYKEQADEKDQSFRQWFDSRSVERTNGT